MKKLLKKNDWKPVLLGLLFAGSLLSGCDPEEPCIALTTSRYNVGFFELSDTGTPVALTENFDSVYAVSSDSVFYRRVAAGITSLGLNLNAASDTTTFIFGNSQRPTDTLQLTYIRDFRLISPECGLEVRFTKPAVVQHTFDSVSVLTDELSLTTTGVDLEIYN